MRPVAIVRQVFARRRAALGFLLFAGRAYQTAGNSFKFPAHILCPKDDGGNDVEQLGWNDVSRFHISQQLPRQLDVAQHRHAGFSCRPPHGQGVVIFAFGNHGGNRAAFAVIVDGNGHVRWIDHQNVRVGSSLRSALLRPFMLDLHALLLDVRIAFGIFHFLADVAHAHAHFLHE